MCVCLHMRSYTECKLLQRPEALDSLELELEMVVSQLMWLWERKLGCVEEQRVLLTVEHLSSPGQPFSCVIIKYKRNGNDWEEPAVLLSQICYGQPVVWMSLLVHLAHQGTETKNFMRRSAWLWFWVNSLVGTIVFHSGKHDKNRRVVSTVSVPCQMVLWVFE